MRASARRRPPGEWLPDALGAPDLRALAVVAMDAARTQGADFADIRIGVIRSVDVDPFPMAATVRLSASFGIRAWRNGTWSFAHGNVLTVDAVASAARQAVQRAIAYAKVNGALSAHDGAVASPPPRSIPTVATGVWAVPVAIDPFAVPLDDYQRVLGSFVDLWVAPGIRRNAHATGYTMAWRAETRVYASMAGTLVTQDFMRGGVGVQSTAGLPGASDRVVLHRPELGNVPAGFEVVLDPNLPTVLQRLREEAVRWRELPLRPYSSVGRVPVLLDGRTTAGVIGATINRALDGDRISGFEADAGGESFLVPDGDAGDTSPTTFSPLLDMVVDRTLPSPAAARWDDDGVLLEPYAVMERGRIVNVHSTCDTEPLIAQSHLLRRVVTPSSGAAVATTPASIPTGSCGHIHVRPAATETDLDDLIREIRHGFLVINGNVDATPGLTGGEISGRLDGVILEVQRGTAVARTPLRLQFRTLPMFQHDILTLGSATTLGTEPVTVMKGMPWRGITTWVTAPAILCKDVDMIA